MPVISTRLAAVCLAIPMASAALSAQSLGDIAKKTQEQRDKAKATPARSYTNETLTADPTAPKPKTESGESSEKSPAPTPATVEKDAAGKKPDEPAKDEAYWRKRMAPLLEKLVRDQKQADDIAISLRMTGPRLGPNLPSRAVSPEVVRLTNALRTLNAVVGDDLWVIEALKEEGRRAGALPSWFR